MDNLLSSASMKSKVNVNTLSRVESILGIGNVGIFPIEGVAIVNVSGNDIKFITDGETIVTVPSIGNLRYGVNDCAETLWLSSRNYIKSDGAFKAIKSIKHNYKKSGFTEELFIVGTEIHAMIYKGDIVATKLSNKCTDNKYDLMCVDKFIIFK